MENLTRYTLSWAMFLVTLCALSGPVSTLVVNASKTESGRLLLSAIGIGGVLPFGYIINLVPLLAFRFLRAVGVFNLANARATPSGWITGEMRGQSMILQERLSSLADCDKVISEARLARLDRWTHLIINYNMMSTLIVSVGAWIVVAILSKDWSLGLFGLLCTNPQWLSYLVVLGSLVILLMVLIITASQTRWELIRAYQIELERLDQIECLAKTEGDSN